MTKTKALKNFINKFLGYEAEGNSVTSVLTDTTENAEGGESDVYIVKGTIPDQSAVSGYELNTDKTYDEMLEAFSAGKTVVMQVEIIEGSGSNTHGCILSKGYMDTINGDLMHYVYKGGYNRWFRFEISPWTTPSKQWKISYSDL